MAKTQYVNIPDELRTRFSRAIQLRDRFYLGVAQSQRALPSRRVRKELSRAAIINSPQRGRGSLFRYLSPLWRALTAHQRDLWRQAAIPSFINGWQLFISDNAARIRNNLIYPVTPNQLWQVNAGNIHIQAPASEIVLKQDHPFEYYVARPIRGRSWKQELVLIREPFSLPLELQIRYRASLTPVSGFVPPPGETVRARYVAEVNLSYQGQDITRTLEIPFLLNTEWTFANATLAPTGAILISYTLKLEIVGYRGRFLFDNIRAIHSVQNWARDPRCDNVNRRFIGPFSIVPPYWRAIRHPLGATFNSQFPPAIV